MVEALEGDSGDAGQGDEILGDSGQYAGDCGTQIILGHFAILATSPDWYPFAPGEGPPVERAACAQRPCRAHSAPVAAGAVGGHAATHRPPVYRSSLGGWS